MLRLPLSGTPRRSGRSKGTGPITVRAALDSENRGIGAQSQCPQLERLTAPDLDPLERQALLLGFAETAVTTCPAHTRNLVADCALRLYEEDPHAAVCSAAELLLRRWGRPPIPHAEDHDRTAVRTGRRDSPGRQVGPNGHVFAVMQAPLEFRMGSPEYERGRANNETLHFRRINRTLAVATKELTIEQFRKFAATPIPVVPTTESQDIPPLTCHGTTRWATATGLAKKQESTGSQWCYPATILPGMRISAAAVDRYGYRLPTEAEWEYLCRTGTETSRPFGVAEDSLDGFAWTWLNSGDATHPTGALLPNEFGLFDVLGNLWEWCHDGPLTDTYERRPYTATDHPAFRFACLTETITRICIPFFAAVHSTILRQQPGPRTGT